MIEKDSALQSAKFWLDCVVNLLYNVVSTLKGKHMAGENKVVNYTAEQTAQILDLYAAGETVEAIATAVGKSARSVIAKLSREGVYKAKAKATGEGRVTKADLVVKIAEKLGADVKALESLEKASLGALQILAAE